MVRLPYGEKYLSLRAPRRAKVFTPKNAQPISAPRKYAQGRISAYFRKNQSLLHGFAGKKACIVVSDNTRFALNLVIVPPLLKELENCGIARNNITILVANGLHVPMSHADLVENMGEEIVNNFHIENHDPYGNLVSFGTTSRGTPLFFNKRFVESDLKIATGLVAPHFHAGFGGGYKSVMIGIAGRDTILKNHRFEMVANDKARYGNLDGNPIYEDILEGGQKSGLHFIVNVTVDSDRRMTHLFIGEPAATHRKAAEAVTDDVKVVFRELFDVVVTTNGGYPLDRNLYQCVKGVAIGELMVKPGGVIILASECRDGVGHEIFQKYMSFGNDPQAVLEKVRSDEPVEDQDNIQILARALTKARVIIVSSGLEPDTVQKMKMEYARSVHEAMGKYAQAKKNLRMAVVPGGPYVLPVGA